MGMERLLQLALGVVVVAAACTATPLETTTTTLVTSTSTQPKTTSTVDTATSTTAGASSTTLADSSLVVVYERINVLYTEGSFTHMELFRYFPNSADAFPVPIVVLDQQAPVRGTVLHEDTHPLGVYELRSYQRPCNGSCGALEPPSDGCAAGLTLEPGVATRAIITVHPGSACTIDVVGAEVHEPTRNMDLTLRPPGGSDCDPESPYDDGALAETLATSTGELVAWGLIWSPPPMMLDIQVKMVFRLTGEGEFDVYARHEDGTQIVPSWGPNDHGTDDSNYGRPGNEWGMAFTFPTAGCWNIHFTRGTETADVWLPAGDNS